MPRNVRSNIELGAQIAIALAVVVAAGVLVKRNFFPTRSNPSEASRLNAGEKLNVPNVNWQQNKKSLVFFLKKDCSHCASSAAFYRELIKEASMRSVKSLAILPDPEQEGREYVKSLGLAVDSIHVGSFQSYKIPGAPTVLFVDRQSRVRSVWFGAVPEREKEMRDRLMELFDEPN